jgi:O-acetylserine/cysteine efflux transporter
MKPLDWGAAFVVILIWAFNFVAGKVGVTQLPPLFLLGLRFGLVALLLVRFLRAPRKPWRQIVVLSIVLGGLHFGLMFTGLGGVDAGPAAIAIQLTVPFSAILAWIVYGERMGILQVAGLVIAFVGVYTLAGEPATNPSIPHFLMVVGGAFAWSVANILIKRLGTINGFVLNAWIAALATPQLFLASMLSESGQLEALAATDWRAWGAIVYMAVGASITAYGLWYYLIGKYEVNRLVPLMLLSPVLAVLLAALFLGEPLTSRIVFGGAITLAGVAMIELLKPRHRQPAAG